MENWQQVSQSFVAGEGEILMPGYVASLSKIWVMLSVLTNTFTSLHHGQLQQAHWIDPAPPPSLPTQPASPPGLLHSVCLHGPLNCTAQKPKTYPLFLTLSHSPPSRILPPGYLVNRLYFISTATLISIPSFSRTKIATPVFQLFCFPSIHLPQLYALHSI